MRARQQQRVQQPRASGRVRSSRRAGSRRLVSAAAVLVATLQQQVRAAVAPHPLRVLTQLQSWRQHPPSHHSSSSSSMALTLLTATEANVQG
jgi:hypothetical protein